MRLVIDEKVRRLDVAVTDVHRMHICNTTQHVVRVELHEEVRHKLPRLGVMFHDVVNRFGTVLHHNIEIIFARLVARHMKSVLQLHNVWVLQLLHDLKLTVLEAGILQHLLDSHQVASLDDSSLVHDAKCATSQDALSVVSVIVPHGAFTVHSPTLLVTLDAVQRRLDFFEVRRCTVGQWRQLRVVFCSTRAWAHRRCRRWGGPRERLRCTAAVGSRVTAGTSSAGPVRVGPRCRCHLCCATVEGPGEQGHTIPCGDASMRVPDPLRHAEFAHQGP
mmetsp:Transcript_32307/g.57155  ORF Transcript_32307/g.57155 Transcript_32307/m.57155 type:complete len:276 (-) Transcript_32307:12-839(-)